MSIDPPDSPGDFERTLWETIPRELERRVLGSLEELKEIFPANEHYEGITLARKVEEHHPAKKHEVYGRAYKGGKRPLNFVAYHCHFCEQIVVGPPRIEDESSTDSDDPLTGREGFDTYCTHCENPLDSHTFALS